MTSGAPADAGYLELLRGNRNFRRLWLGGIVSLVGDWFNTIALFTLAEELTGSPLAMGMVFMTKMASFAVASPIAGIIADRYDRRKLMIGADLVRAAIVPGFLLVDDPALLWLLYLLIFLQLAVGAVFRPAKSASYPNICSPRELLTANALSSATWSSVLAFGSALGGVAVAALGLTAVFLIDSVTYLVSAWFVFRTTIPQERAAPSEGSMFLAAWRDIAAGWRYLITRPSVGRIALAKGSWGLFGGGLVFMLTQLAREVTPGDVALGIGLFFSARGVGTGLGPILARRFLPRRRVWPAVLGLCVFGSGLAYGVLSFAPFSLGLAFGFVVLAHVFSGANWVLSTVLLQERAEDRFRGRVFAGEWLMLTGTDALSILAASLLLEAGVLDLRTAFAVFSAGMLVVGTVWLLVVVPREAPASDPS